MFRELLLGRSDDVKQAGPLQFVKSRVGDLDRLTNEASVIFFGVNISCAKCHDHPEVPNWTQDHFFGMKSFFSRTFDNGGFVGERAYGTVKFKTTSGETHNANPMFLSGQVALDPADSAPTDAERKAEKAQLEKLKKEKQPPPPPKYSRRAKLVELALAPTENRFLARAIVNRVWYRLIGHGLVMPLDQMHPENLGSQPELLDWLANDFVTHQYDLSRLTRGIVLSNTYARSSRWTGDSRPSPELFAAGQVRPLTPMQYAIALQLGTTDPDHFREVNQAELEKRLTRVSKQATELAKLFEQPRPDFQISITEALEFSNGKRIQKLLLRSDADSLVRKLTSVDDDRELVTTAVRTILNRPPTEDELHAMVRFVAARIDRKTDACRQLVWALLGSSECRFNY